MTADTGHGQSTAGQPRNKGLRQLPEGPVWRAVASRRGLIQDGIDCVIWAVALCCATLLRYDFGFSRIDFGGVATLIPVAMVVQTVAGVRFGIYTGRWRFGSFEEVISLVKAVALTSLVLAAYNPIWDPRLVPLSVPFVAGAFALVLMSGVRYAWRLAVESRRRPNGDGCRRMIVFGAGEGAAQVIPQLLRNPDSIYLPVALIDDDPAKRNLRIMGVPVVGDRSRLIEAADEEEADTLLIAMPSAGPELVTELSELGRVAGLTVKVLPALQELFHGQVDVADIRDVTTADLLGRHEIDTDMEAIADYLRGRRVLVTGAGGSIGSELCRQLYRFAPAELIMLDRDESALHAVQLSIEGRALLDSPDLVLTDLRDRRAVGETLERPARGGLPRRRPQAPAAPRAQPGGGGQDQRLGHHRPAGAGGSRRRRALRQHLHRQGRRPVQRAGVLQADHRAPDQPLLGRHRPRRTSASGSATCSAAGARCSPRSTTRSSGGVRSPSPTPTSPGTS